MSKYITSENRIYEFNHKNLNNIINGVKHILDEQNKNILFYLIDKIKDLKYHPLCFLSLNSSDLNEQDGEISLEGISGSTIDILVSCAANLDDIESFELKSFGNIFINYDQSGIIRTSRLKFPLVDPYLLYKVFEKNASRFE